MEERKTAIIIGCGLVGSLAAHFMLKRGFEVIVYEKREDLRIAERVEGRSINLAMSNRARKALRQVGLEDAILERAVPMTGRYLHSKTAKCESIPYDSVTHQCLYSISRNDLNLHLIRALESNPNVRLHFQHKLVKVLPDDGVVTLLTSDNVYVTKSADVIIAADGAYSRVRMEIQQSCRLDFSQTFIKHGYVELSIDEENGHLMRANHLHIWPRGTLMMIALPNFNNSWTVTLFMPFAIFEQILTDKDLISFFNATFPDFFNYCTIDHLVGDFFRKPAQPLIAVKCAPFNFGKVVLIGDAAHAMVPFYGQGMNACFEDCCILDEALGQFTIKDALAKFSVNRVEDAHAICDLALYNYTEMRDLVTTRSFRVRKLVDSWAYRMMPELWIPLYNSVSFTDMRYKECLENKSWQDKVIRNLMLLISFMVPAFGVLIFWLWR